MPRSFLGTVPSTAAGGAHAVVCHSPYRRVTPSVDFPSSSSSKAVAGSANCAITARVTCSVRLCQIQKPRARSAPPSATPCAAATRLRPTFIPPQWTRWPAVVRCQEQSRQAPEARAEAVCAVVCHSPYCRTTSSLLPRFLHQSCNAIAGDVNCMGVDGVGGHATPKRLCAATSQPRTAVYMVSLLCLKTCPWHDGRCNVAVPALGQLSGYDIFTAHSCRHFQYMCQLLFAQQPATVRSLASACYKRRHGLGSATLFAR